MAHISVPEAKPLLGRVWRSLPETEEAAVNPAYATWVLFLVSVLGLFLELMLIRWIGTEIRIFAYLQNTVLVVCFMGLGLGCLTCRKADQTPRFAPAASGSALAHGDPLDPQSAGKNHRYAQRAW